MSKRLLRTSLRILAAIGVAIAILVAVLFLTPFGVRAVTSIGWSRAAGDSGVELSVGSTSGSLVRGITFQDVLLTAQDGTRLLAADRIGARLGRISLSSKRVELESVRIDGAEFFFANGDDGKQVGWSRLGRVRPAELPDGADAGAWEVLFDLALADVTVRVRNAASGLAMVVGPVEGAASGALEEFDMALEGAVSLELRSLGEPIAGEFDGLATLAAHELLKLDSLVLRTNAGNASAAGTVQLRGTAQPDSAGASEADESGAGGIRADESSAGPSADLTIESTHDLSQLTALLGASAASGDLRSITGALLLSSKMNGPFASPAYSTRLRAENVSYGAAQIELLTASLKGDISALTAESLHVEAMGGTVDAEATVEFPDAGDDARFPRLRSKAEFRGLKLDRLAALTPDGNARVSGTLGGTVTIDWGSPGLSNLNASFDLNTSRLVAAEKDLDSLSVRGRVTEGLLVSSGFCCGTSLTADGRLTDDGLRELSISLAADDLAVLGQAFDVVELAGSGTAELKLSDIGASPSLSGTAEFPDLRYGDVQAGPVRVEARGLDGSYNVLYEAFDSSLLGTASLGSGGEYAASAIARSFDLAAVIDDSLREAMSLEGVLSGAATVSGNVGGAYALTGEISELDLAVRRQSAALTAPFSFAVSPDSVRLTEAALAGTFGEASVAGSYSAADALDIVLSFGGAELSELAQLLPEPLDFPPRGRLAGSVRLAGTRRSPVFFADISLVGFEMSGLSLDSVTLEAEGDSSDVMFDVTAASTESGRVSINGAVPVTPDSVTVLRLDAGREFGVSVVSSGFILDAAEPILPGVRGEKRFRVDGSALLTGTVDSLASVTGRGLFTRLSASFDLAEFSLVDTVYFDVAGGRVDFGEFAVDVLRRHVLGEPAGGRVTVGGFTSLNGETRISATSTGLDIGHLVRALGADPGSQIRGKLDADALIEGSGGERTVSFAWSVDSPRLFDFGFDRAAGSGTFEAGALRIEKAELVAGDRSIGVTGTVATGDDGSPELDLRVVASDFRLRRLKRLPPGLDRIDGRLDVDLKVKGRADSLGIDGTALLSGGKLEGFGLAKPITGVEMDAQSQGTTVAVKRLRARSGDGSVDASALVDLSVSRVDPTFLAMASLNSPSFEIEDVIEGSVSGNLTWGGTFSHSALQGRISVEKATVTRSVGLSDLMGRGPRVVVVKRVDDPRANVALDLDLEIKEPIKVESNVAKLSLEGGATVGGTMAAPRVSGSFRAEGGTFNYVSNDFTIEELTVNFIEAERRDPYVKLVGASDVESRSGEQYRVMVRVDGYLNDAVPELTSVPALSQPDIFSLLTFGSTFGGLVSGGQSTGSSGDNFSNLARGAFLSSAFGLAEKTLERLLHLDRVAIADVEAASGNGVDTDVMIGKDFGGRLRVSYTTSVGRSSNQRVEVSFELARRLWLETRTDPEGNHAVGLKFQIPFK
ncbi:MAG: translocation/assembly module TamB domain-containing protein [Candidatus Eisenbacteria bacterium]